jgi:hypothetical protein
LGVKDAHSMTAEEIINNEEVNKNVEEGSDEKS